MEMTDYYRKRAEEYEDVYRRTDPHRQDDLKTMGDAIRTFAKDRNLFELACGTGYWTQKAAETATSITAVDYAPEMLEIAKHKEYACPVEFLRGDAYDLSPVPSTYDAGMAMCWFSHVPKHRHAEFLTGFHTKFAPGSTVFFGDNLLIPGIGGDMVIKDDEVDTYKLRTLADGSKHEILKNYFTEQELTDIFSPYA